MVSVGAGGASDVTVKEIHSIVSQGQTIVLSQETDVAGNVKNTITLGTHEYAVDPARIAGLPPELQPIARQLVDASAAQAAASKPATAPNLEEEFRKLKEQNARLSEEVEQLKKKQETLEKKDGGK